MSSGKRPIVYAVFLVLQLKFALSAFAAGCSINPFLGHPPCNETCEKPSFLNVSASAMQFKPRIDHGNKFPCTVGYKLEWTNFEKKHDTNRSAPDKARTLICKPPLMTKIELHALPYSNRNLELSPSLRVSFDVRFIGQLYKPETKAVLLRFESPVYTSENEKELTDELYSANNGPVYRLFDFSRYDVSSYDLIHPISIDYSCLYGLDHCSTEKVYSITLTALAMNMSMNNIHFYKCNSRTCVNCSLTYTISVHPARYSEWKVHNNEREFENWSMTIATAQYPTNRDIQVLWEAKKGTKQYTVKLLKNNHMVAEQKTEETNTTFKNLASGIYKIQIVCNADIWKNMYTTLHSIDIGHIEKVPSENPSYKIVAAVAGALLAVILVLVIAYFKCMRLKPIKDTSIEQRKYIILSNDDLASAYMSEALHHAFKNLDIIHVESINTLDRPLNNSVIFVLIPAQHATFKFRLEKNARYKTIIEYLVNIRKSSKFNNFRVILVYFPCIKGSKPLQWSCLQSFKRINLINDFNKMLKLLKIKHTREYDLDKVKSDLYSAVTECSQILTNYDKYNQTTPKFDDNNRSYSEDSICPVHGKKHIQNKRSHPYCKPNNCVHFPKNFMNEVTNYSRDFEHETFPLMSLDMIPPSPVPSERQNKIPSEIPRTVSVDTGYGTSRQVSSSSENNPCEAKVEIQSNSLADDDSLHEQIMNVNRDHVGGCQTIHTNYVEDPLLDINFS